VKKIAPVKVPKAVPKSMSRQVRVKSYSPGWIVVCRVSAACLRETSSGTVNGLVVEKLFCCVVVMLVPGGKVGVVAPIGPVTSMEAALDDGSQPAEVVALTMVMSRPVDGVMVRVPKVPGAGLALAAPPRSNDPPAATATTTGAATNRVRNLFLSTRETLFAREKAFG
jgi:hypothetical protein